MRTTRTRREGSVVDGLRREPRASRLPEDLDWLAQLTEFESRPKTADELGFGSGPASPDAESSRELMELHPKAADHVERLITEWYDRRGQGSEGIS